MKKIKYYLGLAFVLLFTVLCINVSLSTSATNERKTELSAEAKQVINKINSSTDDLLNVYFFEQAQQTGDCCIIVAGDTEILIDAGPVKNYMVVNQIIARMESVISSDNIWDYIIVSHADSDHISGLPGILEKMFLSNTIEKPKYKLGTIIDFDITDTQNGTYTGYDGIQYKENFFTTDIYNLYRLARDRCISGGTKYYSSMRAYEHGEFNFGIGSIKILKNYYYTHRFKNTENIQSYEKNLLSVCALIKINNQKLLFTGDLMEYNVPNPDTRFPVYGETYLIRDNEEDLKDGVTFFKAGHHGSNTSNCEKFIDFIRPAYVVVPGVAGTSVHNSTFNDSTDFNEEEKLNGKPVKYDDRIPMIQPTRNMFKYTDNIYIPSEAVLDEEGKTIGYKTYYGEILLQFDGDNVKPYTTANCDIDNNPVGISQTAWFKENREDSLYTYTFNENYTGIQSCALVKYGHYDILINCGTSGDGCELSDKIFRYVVDKKIECLIITSPLNYHYKQLLRGNGGILDKLKVENVLDFGDNVIFINKEISLKVGDGYHYKEKIKGLNIINNNVKLGESKLELAPNLSIMGIESPYHDEYDSRGASLTALITFYDKKLMFLGDLNKYDYLIENYSNDIKNLTYYQSSIATNDYNTHDFLSLINPEYTVIGSPINDYKNEFGDYKYCNRLLSSLKGVKVSKIYPTGYIEGNKYNKLNGDIVFKITFYNGELKKNSLSSLSGTTTILDKTPIYKKMDKSKGWV